MFYYRPQRSCGKVMFLHLSVILFIGQCMLGYGQQAGGTHPTGMQSCWHCFQAILSVNIQEWILHMDIEIWDAIIAAGLRYTFEPSPHSLHPLLGQKYYVFVFQIWSCSGIFKPANFHSCQPSYQFIGEMCIALHCSPCCIRTLEVLLHGVCE